MAERTVSPGVFTNEKDLSFLPAGISQIGAAIIGPTIKGPAFIPTVVTSYNEFVQKFGDTTPNSYVPYTVKEYLKNSGTATIVRTLFEGGYNMDQNIALTVNNNIIAILHPTQLINNNGGAFDAIPLASMFNTSAVSSTISSSFVLTVSGDSVTTPSVISASLKSTDHNYLTKVLPTGPKTANAPAYLYNMYSNALASILAVTPSASVSLTFGSGSNNWYFNEDSMEAVTPWITSQRTNGTSTMNLFKFHTLADGNETNYEVKVAISAVTPAGQVPGSNYGSFTVTIRAVDQTEIPGSPYAGVTDSDSRPNTLEVFTNVNLDPNSTNYIVRRIGDKYATLDLNGKLTYNGDYPNNSVYVRVEVDPDVANAVNSPSLVPFGFRALQAPISSNFLGTQTLPATTYVTNQVLGSSYSKRVYFGYSFDFIGTDNLNFLTPLPQDIQQTTGSNVDFYLGNCNQNVGTGMGTGSIDLSANTSIYSRQFIVPFQGGFDGIYPNIVKSTGADISTADMQGFDFTSVTAPGYIAYQKAIAAVSNPDEFDINMLVMPGTNYTQHTNILDFAMEMALDRGDTFVIIDATGLPAQGAVAETELSNVVNQVGTIDNNYAATYWPWVKIVDANINKPVWVPASVVLPGVIAYSDSVAAEWWAPAGLNRGGLPSVIDAWTRLTQEERDILYLARVNPIATFPGQGICVWGQKTLQAKPSALDRVNVRRMLIAVKKYIASATKYLVFENNTAATRNRFLNIVNPYLSSVQQRQGLYAFKVVMDETNNTPDVIDRNIMYGQIYLQPARAAEFIIIDFNILPTGAAFSQ